MVSMWLGLAGYGKPRHGKGGVGNDAPFFILQHRILEGSPPCLRLCPSAPLRNRKDAGRHRIISASHPPTLPALRQLAVTSRIGRHSRPAHCRPKQQAFDRLHVSIQTCRSELPHIRAPILKAHAPDDQGADRILLLDQLLPQLRLPPPIAHNGSWRPPSVQSFLQQVPHVADLQPRSAHST